MHCRLSGSRAGELNPSCCSGCESCARGQNVRGTVYLLTFSRPCSRNRGSHVDVRAGDVRGAGLRGHQANTEREGEGVGLRNVTEVVALGSLEYVGFGIHTPMHVMLAMPSGQVTSYGAIARLIEHPRYARHVGQALSRLPGESRAGACIVLLSDQLTASGLCARGGGGMLQIGWSAVSPGTG